MKPNSLRISTNRPSSAFFSSPFQPSQPSQTSQPSDSSQPSQARHPYALSPIPDASPSTPTHSSYNHNYNPSSQSSSRGSYTPTHNTRGRNDSQTPLLPPSPAMLEKGPGQGAYPFPAQGRQSWTTRMRMAFAGKVGRGGLARRVLVATLVIMVVLLLGKHVSRGVSGVDSTSLSPSSFSCLSSNRRARKHSRLPCPATLGLVHRYLRIRPPSLLSLLF
jgi:hypothetical protein